MAKQGKQSSTSSSSDSASILRWALPLIFCALAVRIGFLIFDRNFSSYDDGVAAEGARLVLHGAVPYRDFWTLYAPGSFYVNALAFLVFGESMAAIRLCMLTFGAVHAVIFYAIVSRVPTNNVARLGSLTVFLALVPLGANQTYWMAAATACAYFIIRFVEQPLPRWRTLAGLFAGLTLLFRQDAGAYTTLALVGCLLLTAGGDMRSRLKQAGKGLLAAMVLPAAMAVYLGVNQALGAMVDSAVLFPALVFPKVRPLPYPLPWSELLVIDRHWAPMWIALPYQLFGFYLLPLALLVLAVVSVRRAIESGDRREMLTAVLFGLAFALILMLRVRPAGIRLVGAASIAAVAFAVASAHKDRLLRIGGAAGVVASIVAFAPFAVYTTWAQRDYAPVIIPGRGGIRAASGHAEAIAIAARDIREMTRPDEKILCGTPALHFLADRGSPTRFYEPHPGVTDTPSVQREIIGDMESNRVRYFVRSLEWDRDGFFTIEADHQPRLLIDYIEANYQPKTDCYLFVIYERSTPFRQRER